MQIPVSKTNCKYMGYDSLNLYKFADKPSTYTNNWEIK